MPDDIIILFFIFIGTILFLWFAAKVDGKNEVLLNYWADKNNYEVLERRYAYFWELKYITVCRGKILYIITIRDNNGLIKKGHIIFGKCFFNNYSKIENVSTKVTWHR